MSKWRKIRQIRARDLGIMFRLAILLPVTVLALRKFDFRRVYDAFERSHSSSRRRLRRTNLRGSEEERIARVLRLARAVVRYAPYPITCLPRSLVLRDVLRTQGVETELRIGVSGLGEAFEAHAWIEHQGRALGENKEKLQRYKPFDGSIDLPHFGLGTKTTTSPEARS